MSDDLVKRLRGELFAIRECREAADRIEALQRLCGRAERWMGGNLDTLSFVERKALQFELREAAKFAADD